MPSSMYGRRWGRVSSRKVASAPAPSTFAASSVSAGWLCRPASTIRVMNGVHCQTMTAITEISACVLSQATWCTPNGASR